MHHVIREKGSSTSHLYNLPSSSTCGQCVPLAVCAMQHQRVPYTESVSPLTDLVVVYGTEGFQMGSGFVTTVMPQVRTAVVARRVVRVCQVMNSVDAVNFSAVVNRLAGI